MCPSDLPTVNVIEEGHVDEEVEIEGCEGDYDGFDDLQEVQVQMHDSHNLCNAKKKRLFM